MKKKYYKAVLNRNGDLSSVVAGGKACITYLENVWIGAPEWLAEKGYGPCVFLDVEKAIRFTHINSEGLGQVWECEVRKELQLPAFLFVCALSKGVLAISNNRCHYDLWPARTYMFEEVKLIKKVWDAKDGYCASY